MSTYGGIGFGLEADDGDVTLQVVGTIEAGRFSYVVEENGTEAGPFEGPAASLPLALADLIGLGPRPEPTQDAAVLFVEADQLSGTGRASLLEGWDDELRAGTPIAGDGWVLWSAWAAWLAGDEQEVDGFTVIDGGADGLAAVLELDDGIALEPCTSTDVWIALCGLLPRSAELAPAGAAAMPADA